MNKKHMLIMLICCLLPIAGFAAVFLFKHGLTRGAGVALPAIAPAYDGTDETRPRKRTARRSHPCRIR